MARALLRLPYVPKWESSCPKDLGLYILATIPLGVEKFKKWLAETRHHLDKKIEAHDDGKVDEATTVITEEQPRNDLCWIYEIDLDRLVFHVNSRPHFRLDHLPDGDLFLKCIGFDHYGHRAYISSTPLEYRYHWDAPPPNVTDAALELYMVRVGQGEVGVATISDLLSVSETLSDKEATRVQVLQVLVGNMMRPSHTGLLVRELTQVSDHSHLSMRERSFAWALVDILIDPPFFSDEPVDQRDLQTPWRRPNICVRLATHLDDQRNMRAAVAGLIADAMKRPDKSRNIIYGVAFSIFHCVIVRIDTRNGFTLEHTDVLQFLPSFYADLPSTPGITALTRLGYHAEVDVISKVACARVHLFRHVHTMGFSDSLRLIKPITRTDLLMGHAVGSLKPLHGDHIGRRLPQEMWEHVACHLDDLEDLLTLAWFSEECRSAAESALRYTRIGGYRLVRALDSPNDTYNIYNRDEEYDRYGHTHLYSARFEVTSTTTHGVMTLGWVGREPAQENTWLYLFRSPDDAEILGSVHYSVADS